MQFAIRVKSAEDNKTGLMPREKRLSAMRGYYAELVKAGVLDVASGRRPHAKGSRIRYPRKHTTFVDGPFVETKELVAGSTIVNERPKAASRPTTDRHYGFIRCNTLVRFSSAGHASLP